MFHPEMLGERLGQEFSARVGGVTQENAQFVYSHPADVVGLTNPLFQGVKQLM
jgi:hypothetical protein